VEQALGIFVPTLAAAEETEVRDHLALELLVTQLPKEVERLLEVLNCERDPAGGVHERESEVVQRQRLGAPITYFTHDRKRGPVLHDCAVVIAVTSKLRAKLVEPVRFAAAVDFGRGRLSLMSLDEGMGAPRGAVGEATEVLPGGEVVEARLSSPGDPFDRRGACAERPFYPIAALEPKRSGQHTAEQHEDEGEEQHDAEAERPQEPGQQEPDPREREDARTELLAIDRPPE
jgi:hypothetical protein